MTKKVIFLGGVFFLFIISAFAELPDSLDKKFNSKLRPQKNAYLFDYANILPDVREYADNYLKSIGKNRSIEAVIVTVPALEGTETIQELAADILNHWQVGRETGGRGVVLLLADKEKKVKLEVSYELEDVFTDLFCGYVEEVQLKPYFLGGNLGTGLLAVMEELENRAAIKGAGTYTTASIAALDKGLLSGGAGAKKNLSAFQKEEVKKEGSKYPAGKTPEEAWKTFVQSWRDKARDPNLGVYTGITKLTYRDYQNAPDSRYEDNVRKYADKPYQVLQKDNYAVIFFGDKPGWDNAPFLFCRTPEGWQFDIVHQRKYIRMGSSPSWGIERADYPYVDLLSKCPYWMTQDIPLEGDDVYRIQDDQKLADSIVRLEEEYKNKPDDFNTVMELGKLYTITAMVPKHFSLLNKAKQLNPDSALPYKYLAIAHVDANFQYETAMLELKEYVKRVPQDVFGHNYLGYLYFCVKDYEKAIDEFQKAVSLRADNCYAFCKLSRCYGQRYLKAAFLDPRRKGYKNSAIEMLNKAEKTAIPDERRIRWLQLWLKEEGLFESQS